jgi:tetratricopeptide (TPR) repeat protein
MLFAPEFMSLPLDWNMLLGAGLAVGASGLASVFAHEHAEEVDLDAIQKRVAELEKSSTRTLEQNGELATLYATWASTLSDTVDDVEVEWDQITSLFGKAETILKTALAQGEDKEIRHQLGNVYLEWAVAYNGNDDLPQAVVFYQQAIQTLKPLEDAGDGDAKYDIAGIKLNLGIAYRELGELEKAKASLDESFLTYRAVEKICADDTRFFMATVSIQQGNILHEMGEELDSVLDAYNRAMRLLVEVIEDQGETALERDLANVLLDRCMVTYEHWIDQKFESDAERESVINDVLLNISRGIELLEKQCLAGNKLARFDLFHGLALQGKVACDAEKYDESKKSLDRVINDFADLCADDGDDVFLMQMTMAYANRAVVHLVLGDKNASGQDCQKGSELIDKLLQSDSEDEEILELKQQFQQLLEQLK